MHRIAFAIALASSALTPVAAAAQNTGTPEPEGVSPTGEASTEAKPDVTPAEEAASAAKEDTAPADEALPEPNEVTLGVQWVGGKNTGLFGRYNGLTYEGLDLVGGFAFRHRDPGDSGSTLFYDFSASDLLLQTGRRLTDDFRDNAFRRSTSNHIGPESVIDLRIGRQGSWEIDAGYNAITYTGNIINSIFTMNGTTGTLNNGLPPWGGATNVPMVRGPITSYTAPVLSQAERQFQTGTRRDIFRFGAKYRLGDWTISSGIRHEHKEGSLEQSLRLI